MIEPRATGGLMLSIPPEALAQLVAEVTAAVLAELSEQANAGESWPEWMGIATAARYLDVPVERLRKQKERRAIPHHQQAPGCRVFFRRSELDRFMEQSKHQARRRGWQ